MWSPQGFQLAFVLLAGPRQAGLPAGQSLVLVSAGLVHQFGLVSVAGEYDTFFYVFFWWMGFCVLQSEWLLCVAPVAGDHAAWIVMAEHLNSALSCWATKVELKFLLSVSGRSKKLDQMTLQVLVIHFG